jgi:hypothetical protein
MRKAETTLDPVIDEKIHEFQNGGETSYRSILSDAERCISEGASSWNRDNVCVRKAVNAQT